MSKHDAIQCEFRILGTPEKAMVIGETVTIEMDPYGFHTIGMRVQSKNLAQELADAINTVLEGHRARSAERRAV